MHTIVVECRRTIALEYTVRRTYMIGNHTEMAVVAYTFIDTRMKNYNTNDVI